MGNFVWDFNTHISVRTEILQRLHVSPASELRLCIEIPDKIPHVDVALVEET
jgi:hypothetical protein